MLSADSMLLPGLCFALFDQDMHFVPQGLLGGSVPIGTSLQKYFLVPDIRSLQEELHEAQTLGPAAAEEWIKGLAEKGRSTASDAARFENWESSGGLDAARRILASCKKSLGFASDASGAVPQTAARPLPVSTPLDRIALASVLPPLPAYPAAPGMENAFRFPQAQSDTLSMGSQASTTSNKASKQSRDRARIRSHKKADIMRRCLELHPPITRDMLERLDAFEAAMKIPMPLNDSSWNTLKDRLLRERHKIVLEDERKRAIRTEPGSGRFELPARTDEHLLAHMDTDKKERLCQIAQEYIKQKWGYGAFVHYASAPSFAAEVLMNTRIAYLQEQEKVSNARIAAGQGTTMPKPLLLEDMKHVFEQTIRPRTEQIRKDLYLCPICPVDGSPKYFAFESVIQHYASKHTDAFSNGPKKVYWQSLWPDEQPFHLHPERVHTPEPSITHTPTLTDVPMSVTSASSAFSRPLPSAGWRSPDTMSLLSSTTHTYSAAGRPASQGDLSSVDTSSGMYELQRRDLIMALVDSGTALATGALLPGSLRAFIVTSAAIAAFRKKYSNFPSLQLFMDAILNNAQLEGSLSVYGLLCAECTNGKTNESHILRRLPDLCEHFKQVHAHSQSDRKVEWHHDLFTLPSTQVIKDFITDPRLSPQLHTLMQEALQTATIQQVNFGVAESVSVTERQTIARPHEQVPFRSAYTASSYDQSLAPYPPIQIEYRQSYPIGGYSSLAATHGVRSISQDASSISSRTIADDRSRRPATYYIPVEEPDTARFERTDASQRGLHGHSTRQARPVSRDDDIEMPSAQTMTRTNTVRSYHSKDHRQDDADDFLSKLDAHLDTEMGDSGTLPSRSTRPSRAASTTSHRPSHSLEQDIGPQQTPVLRAPALPVEERPERPRFIELYPDGDPTAAGQRGAYYHENIPPQTYYRPAYEQDPRMYGDSRSYAERPVDRIYDPTTGRYYVEERPIVRYVPIDAGDPRYYEPAQEETYPRGHDARTFPGR